MGRALNQAGAGVEKLVGQPFQEMPRCGQRLRIGIQLTVLRTAQPSADPEAPGPACFNPSAHITQYRTFPGLRS